MDCTSIDFRGEDRVYLIDEVQLDGSFQAAEVFVQITEDATLWSVLWKEERKNYWRTP